MKTEAEARQLLSRTPEVLDEVMGERLRQAMKWGEQSPPDLNPGIGADPEKHAIDLGIPTAASAKAACQAAFKGDDHNGTWALIALEEFCEAIEAAAHPNQTGLRDELIQCAAVFVAWVEALDRRSGR